MKTDNGYVGTGWARNAFASSSIKGELHFLDMDRLTSETCRWRIRSAGPDKLGGLVMTMVQGAVSLVGQVNFGLFEADVGVVGSFGHIRFSKA
ncbi:hypothetical protein FRC03_010591 [Tulasnella sp. 419]|nr:hypothetical protein FRC03_010591 [Tulasnella sp. 419]